MASIDTRHKNRGNLVYIFQLLLWGMIFNIPGLVISQRLGGVFYLNCIGTILVSLLGGYMPGILVGLVTVLIKNISDPLAIYYLTLNVFVAIIAAYGEKKGVFKSLWKFILLLLALCVGDAIYSCLVFPIAVTPVYPVWLENIRVAFEGFGNIQSYFFTEFIVDLADKLLSFAVVVAVLRFIPDKLKEKFKFGFWQQEPLSDAQLKEVRKIRCRTVSIRTKILVIFVGATVCIALSITAISIMLFNRTTVDEYERIAEGAARLAAGRIDAEKVDTYIEKGEKVEGYTETEDFLYELKANTPNVEYVYVYKITNEGCVVVFDLDTEEMEGSEPGSIIPVENSFRVYISDLLEGKEIPPIITNETYGSLLTYYCPVYDKTGECVCYAAVDVSMVLISQSQKIFLLKLLALFFGFFIIIITTGLWIAEYNITLPVNTMSVAANAFAYNTDLSRVKTLETIENLDIHTGDEIENLYKAFSKTTGEAIEYVGDIQRKNETIQKMQSGLIMVLADMVEGRDKNTGDHIKKTAAYVKIIAEKLKENPKYSKILTPTVIADMVSAAPLHDLGKIKISDAVLNKPGKLTDEEFELMKTHTTAGKEIMEQVMEKVPNSGYLAIAKDLAYYHHEKWNGKGYPEGLKGEEIPLAARIMAIADVFDALVSERCYKKPFTFEKAMSIIKEDAGTHFDPDAAQAFIDSEEKVREVAGRFTGSNA
ncbi:MAG: HD domain-containing protein [Firmicutes bacterium]|nr:HD domain-containing protein [Bacillota bacterium]